jgi:hypothetical protein
MGGPARMISTGPPRLFACLTSPSGKHFSPIQLPDRHIRLIELILLVLRAAAAPLVM